MDKQAPVLNLDGVKLPYSVEAEQAVLGSIIIDPKCLNIILSGDMSPNYFYIPQHGEIFRILCTMMDLNQKIDFITLLEQVKAEGIYDDVGGKAYIRDLVQSVPSAANVITYVNIVREKYYTRSLISASQEIINDASKDVIDSSALLELAEQRIYNIRNGREVTGLTSIKTVLDTETLVRLNKIANPETRDEYLGISCGIKELNDKITGLNKSDLIILGARPGMGKTSFALNIARNVAVDSGKTVCFFSLEMSRDQLAMRMLSAESGVDSKRLRNGELAASDFRKIAEASAHLSQANIFFDETSSITVPQIKAKIRRMKNKVDLVIIDYLGLMHTPERIENRVQEVSEITRSLKIMAKELHVPVIACAQLSRGTESKGLKSHKPILSDLRDSGSIEQDADIVLFLYREHYYDSSKGPDDAPSDDTKAECIIAKNRHGETGKIDLYWDKEHTRYTSPVKYEE